MNFKTLSLSSFIEMYEESVDKVLEDIKETNNEDDIYERTLMKLFS